MPGVKYITKRQCCNCNTTNLGTARSCAMCGYLFLGEASDEEIRTANRKKEEDNYKENQNEED